MIRFSRVVLASAITLVSFGHLACCQELTSPVVTQVQDGSVVESLSRSKTLLDFPRSVLSADSASYANRYYLTHIADGSGWRTTLSLINPTSATIDYQVQLRDDAGNPLLITSGGKQESAFEGTLPSGGSAIIASSGPGSLSQGIAQVNSTSPMIANGIFMSRAPGRTDLEAAVPSFSEAARSLLLPFDNVEGRSTGLALANIGDVPVTVAVSAHSESGKVINLGSLVFGSKQKVEFNLSEKFPIVQNMRGTLIMSAGAPVLVALGLRFLPCGTFTSLPVYSADSIIAPRPLQIFSHLVDGSGWSSTITIVNLDAQPATYQLKTFESSGTAMALVLNGVMATNFSGTIPGLSAVTLSTPGNSTSLLNGWAELTSTGRVRAQLMFDQVVSNQLVLEAAVPAANDKVTALAIPFDNTDGLSTGIAVANGSSEHVDVRMIVRDELAAFVDVKTLRLPARGKTSFAMSDRSPNSANKRGYIMLSSSNSSISALALRFNGPAFTTLPVTPIDPVTGVPLGDSAPTQTAEPPQPPSVEVLTLSSSEIRITWTSAEQAVIRFRLERRSGTTGSYVEVAQPGPTMRSMVDVALSPSTLYTYRIRVETSAGISNYSSEVSATTAQGLPNAPTGLRAAAATPTEATLSWTNNAPDAFAVRVEYRSAGAATFADIGAAASLSNTGITGLQLGTTYTFRVRAQNAAGFSAYSNEATTTTSPAQTTVFLVHGIQSDSSSSQLLKQTLMDPTFGLDQRRFVVDAGFNWPCAKQGSLGCDATCSIEAGADELARYIVGANAAGDIVIIGHSMGGLLAREMLRGNYRGVANLRRVRGLVTLGTPNVGYPYVAGLDDLLVCKSLAEQMWSDYRTQQDANLVYVSPFLGKLNGPWTTSSGSSQPLPWLAAAGTFCKDPTRSFLNPVGCPDRFPSSDGVVCQLSATAGYNYGSDRPSQVWSNDYYAHYASMLGRRNVNGPTILCSTISALFDYFPLSDPPASGSLVQSIRGFLNALQ